METTMRTEAEIRVDIAAARESYELIVHEAPAGEVRAASDVIKALQAELAATLAAGAEPCPICQRPAHGMLKTPEHINRGKPVAAVYEVGCLDDPVQFKAPTAAEAVAGWNAWVARTRSRTVTS